MPPLNELIGKMDFFAGLDRKLLRKVEESAIVCLYGNNEVIIQEGEMGLGMYVILRGRVAVTKNRSGLQIRLAELGPEQFFAEMSLIDDKPRSATITTLEETECLLLTRDSFAKLMEKNPQLSIRLARVLAERLRNADEHSQAIENKPPVVLVTAGPPVLVVAEAAPSAATLNGSGNHSTALSGKEAVQQKLLGTFERLYTVKAFTRFSVAVLGCPVEGTSPHLIEEFRIGHVKALIFPADEPVEMRIAAFGAGSFNLHVFTPDRPTAVRFGPVQIEPDDTFTLNLPSMSLSSGQTPKRPADIL